MDIFENPLPESIPDIDLDKKNKPFSVQDVKEWVEKNNSMDGRFEFFETYAASSEFTSRLPSHSSPCILLDQWWWRGALNQSSIPS